MPRPRKKEIRQRFLCHDCGFDTYLDAGNEYYMLHNHVWNKARNGEKIHMLCIGCVEKRLGRMLNQDDFAYVPLNYPGLPIQRSERLQNRLNTRGDQWISTNGSETANST